MNLNEMSRKAYQKAGGVSKSKNDVNKIQSKAVNPATIDSDLSEDFRKQKIKPENSQKFEGDPAVKNALSALTKGGLIKISSSDSSKEAVYRRVAKFLILIGVDQAACVMKHLTQEETEKIIPEITSIRSIDNEEALAILAEFEALKVRVEHSGGKHTAFNILEKAFGADRAEELMQRLSPVTDTKPFAYLEEKETEKILELLKDESNQIKALVLSYLKPKISADVIKLMKPEDKKEVIVQLAKVRKISPDVISRVDKAMHEKSNAQIDIKTQAVDGRGVLAEILKKMDFSSEQEILDNLKESDPELTEDLANRLFTIEDVLNADDKYIQNHLRSMNDLDIAYLIAGQKDAFRQKILSNLSTVRAGLVLDEEEIHKPMRKSECLDVTGHFLRVMRRAWEDGKLIINGRDDEIYV